MRIEQLTFTRFLAAMSIVVFHFGRDSKLFSNDYVAFMFNKANTGVSYFFVLSGFVMIIAYKDRLVKFSSYIRNRIARIYPVYFLAILLMLILKNWDDIKISDVFLNLTMLQSWVSEKSQTLNYPGWSLSVELFFYICFPIIYSQVYKKVTFRVIAIITIGFWVISQVFFYLVLNDFVVIPYYSIHDLYYHPVLHLNEFLIGNLAGLYFLKKSDPKEKRSYLIHVMLFVIVFVLLLKYPIGIDYHNGFLAIVFVPIIYFFSKSHDIFTKLFSKKPFVFLGEISYSVYILQVPVWIFLTDFRMNKYFGLEKDNDVTTLFLVRCFILILTSAVCYLFFEKPIRKRIKSYF